MRRFLSFASSLYAAASLVFLVLGILLHVTPAGADEPMNGHKANCILTTDCADQSDSGRCYAHCEEGNCCFCDLTYDESQCDCYYNPC
jgi:hypothetical protein